MIRVLMLLATLVSALLVQAVVAPALAFGEARPPIVLVTVIVYALAGGPVAGVRYGFLAGIAIDLLGGSAQLVGVNAFAYMLTGYGAGLVQPYLVSSGLLGDLVAGGVATALGDLLATTLGVLLGAEEIAGVGLLQQAMTAAAYGAALVPPLTRAARTLRAGRPSDQRMIVDGEPYR